MKIGVFDPYLDDVGGGEKYMLSLASCLSKDNDVTFFWDSKDEFKIAKDRFSIDLSRVSLSPNIFSGKTSLRKRLLETKKFDVIIFLTDGSIPVVFSKKLFIHGQRPIRSLEKLSVKDKVKILKVTKFFFNSDFTKSYMDSAIKNRGLTIYPPIDLYPKNVKKENIILTVGRFRAKNVFEIDNYKKQDVMIEVFKKMIDKGLKNWRFVLAVSVNEKDKTSFEKLKELGKGYPIEFLINKKNRDLWDVYNSAKIYWHAAGFGEDLIKQPEYAEHFGISTVEAMGAGCVPVVINAGGQKEIVADGKDGFLWQSEKELIERTEELIENKKLWERLSKAAQKKSEKFANGRFCKEITKLVNS